MDLAKLDSIAAEIKAIIEERDRARIELTKRVGVIDDFISACGFNVNDGFQINADKIKSLKAERDEAQAKCAEMREAQIKFPDNLSALTVGLVLSFAQAMADKLSAAQIKHGYGDGWAETTHEWPIPECHEALMSHLKKGDPVDVANFCAFLWYHKIGTTDCGKGWKSPEEYAALEAKCAEMRDLIYRMYHYGDDDRSPSIDADARRILSTDCGKDMIHVRELEQTIYLLRCIANDYDCDTGANGTHPHYCRSCTAKTELARLQALKGNNKP